MENKWAREIDFKCEFGLWPFRRTFEINQNGFLWCGELFPLKTITRLRWGVDQKRGGIFPKVVFVMTFGTEKREFTVKTKQKDFYEHLTTRCWRAVGRRLLSEMSSGLAAGRRYRFGELEIADEGAYLAEKSLFGAAEEKFTSWSELRWEIANGSICLTRTADAKYIGGASFLWADNAHVLSAALELLRLNGGKSLCRAINAGE